MQSGKRCFGPMSVLAAAGGMSTEKVAAEVSQCFDDVLCLWPSLGHAPMFANKRHAWQLNMGLQHHAALGFGLGGTCRMLSPTPPRICKPAPRSWLLRLHALDCALFTRDTQPGPI